MHIQVFNMPRCFAMHMMSWQVLVFKTPGVLQRLIAEFSGNAEAIAAVVDVERIIKDAPFKNRLCTSL